MLQHLGLSILPVEHGCTELPPLVDELSPELRPIYLNSRRELDSVVEDDSPTDLSVRDVLRAHFMIADYFYREGEGIGGFGPRSVDMLASAVMRQSVAFGGISKWTNIHQKAATLLFGLVMNHPFHDANKRTAYLSTVYYYYKNGYVIEATEKQLEDFTVEIAEHNLKKYPRYRDLRKKSDDPEIEFISHWLRGKTRKADNTQYFVTYRELNKLLGKYDCWLANPHNNYIDLMQRREVTVPRKPFFWGAPKKEIVEHRVCALGFPGWSKQVGKGRMAYVRQVLDLTPANGIDAQAFFNDLDDMKVLIEIYEGALKRLADR